MNLSGSDSQNTFYAWCQPGWIGSGKGLLQEGEVQVERKTGDGIEGGNVERDS